MSPYSTKFSLAVSLLALMAAAPAVAQTADAVQDKAAPTVPPEDNSLTEIVVTARRVAENQQTVPVSLTAVSGEALRQQDVSTVTDLQRVVPSLNVTASLSRNSTSFSMRGQRETTSVPGGGGGPAVVAYFAEAPFQALGPGSFFDLQNVQVLKGPQGTLFGQNTTGGAILFEPQRPTNTYEGYLSATVGNYGRRDVEGAINVPLIDDKLLLRVAGTSLQRDGFTHDVNTGRDYDNRNAWSGRVSLLFRPNAVFENYTVGYISGFQDHGTGVVLEAVNPASPFAPFLAPYFQAQQARGIRHVALGARSRDLARTAGVVNRTTFKLTDTLSLTNIASYTHYRRDNARDEDGTVLPIQDSNGAWMPGTWNSDYSVLTEELRLSGSLADELLKFQAGGYYDKLHPEGTMTYTQALQMGATSSQLSADPRSRSRAVFGQLGLDMGKVNPALEGLNLTAGYRYTWNDYFFGTELLVYPGVLAQPPLPQAGDNCLAPPGQVYPNCAFSASSSDKGESFAFGADYALSKKVMVFANYKRGYKAGGFNPIVIAFGGTPSTPGYKFRPEQVDTAEIGVKSDWSIGDVRGRLNLTAYTSKYRDIHANVNTVIPPFTTSIIQNAARATINGLEAEAEVRLSRALMLNAGYSYTDAQYDKYVTPQGQDLSALPFVYTPKNQFNLGAHLTLPTPESVGDVTLHATYTWQDRVYAGDTDVTQPRSFIDAYGLLGLRLDWKNPLGNDHFDVAAFATNLTDKTYRTGVIQQYAATGYTSSIYGDPRMYGVSLRAHF